MSFLVANGDSKLVSGSQRYWRSTDQAASPDFGAREVLQHRNHATFLPGCGTHQSNRHLMGLGGPMGEVEPKDIDPCGHELADRGFTGSRRPERRDNLGLPHHISNW